MSEVAFRYTNLAGADLSGLTLDPTTTWGHVVCPDGTLSHFNDDRTCFGHLVP